MTIIVSAPGVRLRPWRPADAADLAAAFRDPVLRRFLLHSAIDSEDDARRWIDGRVREQAAGIRFTFAVLEVLTDGDNDGVSGPIGNVAVKGMAAGNNTAEIGYWMSAGARGRGIASRAVEAVAVWTFATQPVERLELLHSVNNPASCGVARKCGFVFDSVLAAEPPEFPVPGHRHVRASS